MNKLLFTCIFLFACAIEKPMSGGPEDTLAPFIIQSIPAYDSLNYISPKRFYFQFSERVDRKSFEQSIYLLPFGNYRKRFLWDGWDEVSLEIDSLQTNLTYQLVVAKGFKDLHQVKSLAEFRRVFTAESLFDSLSLQGQFSFRKNMEQCRIAFFESSKINELPRYIADLDSLNSIQLRYLKYRNYYIYLFNDLNSNYKIDLEKEELVFLHYGNTISKFKDLTLVLLDTIAPQIKSIDTLFYQQIKVDFSECIDLNKSRIYIEDSVGRKFYPERHYLLSGNSVLAYFPDMEKSKRYRFAADLLTDNYSNQNDSIKEKLRFISPSSIDSALFQLNTVSIKDSSTFKDFPSELILTFSTTIYKYDSVKAILESQNKPLKLKIDLIDHKRLRVYWEEPLKSAQFYQLKIQLKAMSGFDRKIMKDSLINIRFYTASSNNYGNLIFKLNANKDGNYRYRLHYIAEKTEIKENHVQISKTTIIRDLKAGKYLLDIYRDRNNNQQFDAIQWRPLQASESLYFYPDTIRIRANWDRELKEITLDDSF